MINESLTSSLHTTPDGALSSASRSASFGPACVSSIVRRQSHAMTRMLSISISCIISAPTIAMCILWIAMFISPALGSKEISDLEKLFFLALFASSICSCFGGIIYFFVTRFFLAQKSWDVVMCLSISLFGILMNICGFICAIGIAGGSVG